jgi:hypothetical protein
MADERDHSVINETLRIDPDARQRYVRAMLFEGMLAAEFAADGEDIPKVASSKTPSGPWLRSMAAAIVIGAFLAWMLTSRSADPIESTAASLGHEAEVTHAVVSLTEHAKGSIGGNALSAGMRLPYGTLELDSGLAEITFDSGAELILEGPASLSLESASRSRLDRGRASAMVPEEASGFVIHTPTSFIREMKTQIAIEVLDDTRTDLHVLDGRVEVAATGRSSSRGAQVLRQSEAVRLANGGIVPILFRPEASPGAKMKRVHRVPPSVHWSFDQWDGSLQSDAARNHFLEFRRNEEPAYPDLVEGPYGSALRLDGAGGFASTSYPGIGGSQPRTVAFWVRIDPVAPTHPRTPNGIVSWGVNRSSAKWQIGWNNAAREGNIGAPRVEFGKGFVIGSTDLRDGRWHHLTVVYLGGAGADVSTHVRIYLNGRLEPLSGRLQQTIRTQTQTQKAQPLVVGRYLGQWKNRDPFYFAGDLDELHVFEGALLPKQIVRLKERNSARVPPR